MDDQLVLGKAPDELLALTAVKGFKKIAELAQHMRLEARNLSGRPGEETTEPIRRLVKALHDEAVLRLGKARASESIYGSLLCRLRSPRLYDTSECIISIKFCHCDPCCPLNFIPLMRQMST